jgi:hypothetical protein
MTEREELETALARAEAAQKYLEAALVKAESALVNTATDVATIGASRDEASAKVERARARCRQLRSALVNSNHSEFITRSRERVDTRVKQSEELSKREVTANPPSIQSRDHTLRVENKRSQGESRRRKPIRLIKIGLPGQERSPKDAHARSTLIRQAIGFLALILAYLLYFHIDVQLQILRLLSRIFAWAPP